MDTAEALGFDPDDVYAVLVATDASCVRKIEADEQYPERTVIVMNLTASERSLYVKVSLNLQINHDVRVLSFKDWST